ncbi:hypothetical protein DFH27DRAFT_530245 [Peziza echinospora]|nr:hypothetical protein DFH27DRAFT_530245 [Peziza echinospora]
MKADHDSVTSKQSLLHRVAKRSSSRWYPLAPTAAMILIILSLCAALTALKQVDGAPTNHGPWKYATPNVALSICTITINLLLGYALCEGTTLAWWIDAKKGATLSQLHWAWDVTSIMGVVRGFARLQLSRISIATLAVSAVASHGVFFQRSVRVSPYVEYELPVEITNIDMRIADQLPTNFTGQIQLDGEVGFLTERFTTIVRDTVNNKPLYLNVDKSLNKGGCPDQGMCLMILQAAGYTASVDNSAHSVNTSRPDNATTNSVYTSRPDNVTAKVINNNPEFIFKSVSTFKANNSKTGFYVSFSNAYEYGFGAMIAMILYKPRHGCNDSAWEQRKFLFRPATITYMIEIDNTTSRELREPNRAKGGITQALSAVPMELEDQRMYPNTGKNLSLDWQDHKTRQNKSPAITPHEKRLEKLYYSGVPLQENPVLVPIEYLNKYPGSYGGVVIAIQNVFDSYSRFLPEGDVKGGVISNNNEGDRTNKAKVITQQKMTNSKTGTDMINPSLNSRAVNASSELGPSYESSGILAQQYYSGSYSNGSRVSNICDTTWTDPTREILSFINHLMFRSAVAAADINVSSMEQSFNVTSREFPAAKTEYVPTYKVAWMFAWIGAAIPIAGILLVLPTYWGFWNLDRGHTDSPMEAVYAFDQDGKVFGKSSRSSGKKFGDVVKSDVGKKKVVYIKDGDIWGMREVGDHGEDLC